MIVSVEEFRALTKSSDELAAKYYNGFIRAVEEFGINEPIEVAALLAQVSVETGCLRFMREIWGPTSQQDKYDPPNSLAVSLGNTEKGDGFRYRGGGMLQITGKYNYHLCGLGLGVNLISSPDVIVGPYVAASSACWWWVHRELGAKLKKQGIDAVTQAINGGDSKGIERKANFKENIGILCV